MSEANTLSTTPAAESARERRRSLPLLIEVPSIKVRPHPTATGPRIEHGQPQRTRALPRSHSGRRPRRRLRRQVRLAGCALLFLAPVVSACTIGWSGRPSRVVACAIPDAPDGDDPSAAAATGTTVLASPRVIVRSIEPALATPAGEPDAPVIFPGYVLPDDNFEDTAHEGS